MKIRFLIFLSAVILLTSLFISCGGSEFEGAQFSGEVAEFEQAGQIGTSEDVVSVGKIISKTGESAPLNDDKKVFHNLPTGQKLCYDEVGEIPCPLPGEPFFGQDSQRSVGVRSYTDNSDETVTDGNTGLVWQKSYKSDVTWYEAESYCRNLSIAGHGWRLPKPHELRTLIDYNIYDPAIDLTAFPDTPSDWFWASKHAHFNDVTSGEESSWIISFFDGFVEYTARYNYYSVRCVMVE